MPRSEASKRPNPRIDHQIHQRRHQIACEILDLQERVERLKEEDRMLEAELREATNDGQ